MKLILIINLVIGYSNSGCYEYIRDIVQDRQITEAILLSSEENNISPSVMVAYLITENHKFKNLPLNESGDVGIFQININYHPYDLAVLMDVRKNALIAGRIIREKIFERPNINGIGGYHSWTPKRNRSYRNRFLRNLKRVLKRKESYTCE